MLVVFNSQLLRLMEDGWWALGVSFGGQNVPLFSDLGVI